LASRRPKGLASRRPKGLASLRRRRRYSNFARSHGGTLSCNSDVGGLFNNAHDHIVIVPKRRRCIQRRLIGHSSIDGGIQEYDD
ncbi:MAG: hypothetical protein II008_22240, partial [Oscillospiraceae bacterium]|nr:hypothetical protein [Oscillospiraceae bacterium]